jgi:hypothetical protein
LPSVLGAILLLALVGMVLLLPLVLLLRSIGPTPTPGAALGGVVAMLAIFVLVVAAYARLLPLTPVGVAEPVGPIEIIRRSWRLTAGHFWRLFGTLVAIGIVFLIVSFAITLAFGLLVLATIGNPVTNQTASFVVELLSALFTSAVAVFLLSFTARIYAQLAERAEETGQVFR